MLEEAKQAVAIINYTGTAVSFLIFLGTGLMYAVWLRPFLEKARPAYLAGFSYFALTYVAITTEYPVSNALIFDAAALLTFLILWGFERKNLRQKIFLCVIYMVIRDSAIGAAAEANFYISDIVSKFEVFSSDIPIMLTEYVMQQIVWMLMSVLLLYLAVRIFHKVFIRKKEDIGWRDLAVLLAPSLPILLTGFMRKQYIELWNQGVLNGTIRENIHGNAFLMLYYASAYIVILIVVSFYMDSKNGAEELKEIQLIESQQKQLRAHIRRVEELAQSQRDMRHDMGNHIQVIEHLVAGGSREEAAEYLGKWKSEWQETSPEIRTGNPVIDVILSEKSKEAAEKGISFASDFRCTKNEKIDAYDLSVIINNALDNSIENANGVEPYIRIASVQEKNIFMIVVKNSFYGEIRQDPETGFPDVSPSESGHGIGLRNIRRVAEKYMGEALFEHSASEVTLSVMLQLTT